MRRLIKGQAVHLDTEPALPSGISDKDAKKFENQGITSPVSVKFTAIPAASPSLLSTSPATPSPTSYSAESEEFDSKAPLALSPVEQFLQDLRSLSEKVKDLEKAEDFPEDHRELLQGDLPRVSVSDIKGIYRWILGHSAYLETLSVDNSIIIRGNKSGEGSSNPITMTFIEEIINLFKDTSTPKLSNEQISGWILRSSDYLEELFRRPQTLETKAVQVIKDYDYPITLHFIEDSNRKVRCIFYPGSKLARRQNEAKIIKESETKQGGKPRKQIGKGGQKVVNHSWCLQAGMIEPYVGAVVMGDALERALHLKKNFYPLLNPLFMMPGYFSMKYLGHSKKDKYLPKLIIFSPRAVTVLSDFMRKISLYKPGLADMLFICHAFIRSVVMLHAMGWMHCDIKPKNVLVVNDDKKCGWRAVLNDFDFVKTPEEAKSSHLAGTPSFMAWDLNTSFYSPLVRAHNDVLVEMQFFKGPPLQMSEDIRKLYDHYISIVPSQDIKDTEVEYMRRRARDIISTVRSSAGMKGVDIILKTKKPIEINKYPDFKDDVYSLCLSIENILEQFRAYQTMHRGFLPLLFEKICTLMNEFMQAPRATRGSAKELMTRFEALILAAQPKLDDHTKESESENYLAEYAKRVELLDKRIAASEALKSSGQPTKDKVRFLASAGSKPTGATPAPVENHCVTLR